ncbi:unnamed protein product [Tuber aestivum]|uniref:ubiquitinyl hydrolase 1 n=1 Tax=Tuber aestivum TaxID=59557 RepID=A0A292PZW6_9PEZI|nr:unnamed protein product [Tuber aestivum]
MNNLQEQQDNGSSPAADSVNLVTSASDSSALLRPSTQAPSTSAVSRSQSPAKRLKSEELSSAELVSVLEPMDEDTVMPSAEEKSGRESSVEMADGSVASSEGNGEVARIDAISATASIAPSTATTVGSTQPSSTSATSVSSVSIPSLEDQAHFILKSKFETKLNEGDLGYIISGRWLNRLLARSSDWGVQLTKEDAESEIGPIDNSDLVDETQMQGQAKNTSDDSTFSSLPFLFPGCGGGQPISSTPLSKTPVLSTDRTFHEGENDEDSAVPEDFVAIKPGTLGDDFEILPEEAWNSLVSWHGLAEGSPVITRRAVDTSETIIPHIQYEIYPPAFTLYKLRDPSTNVTRDLLDKEKLQSPMRITAGKTDSFQKLLRKVKKLAGVDAARKIRLWRIIENSSEHDLESTSKPSRKGGKEKDIGPFKQLVIDLQPFLDLNIGAERELVELRDQSNDPKYNGSMKISMAGLGAGGPIVIEEQGSDGEWISEKPTKSVRKGGQQVTVALNGKNVVGGPGKKKASARPDSPSGSLSAAVIRSGFPNRLAERREGRPLGKCNKYTEELNPNNPLSHSGKVAKAYATLLGYIFSPTCPGSVSPREFKSTISRFSLSFSGYGQQDTQEFLAFLLDGLHEDLNRIQKKPYIEKPESTDEMVGDNEAIAGLAQEHWAIYKQRNDSVIADLFGGLYQSTLVCPDCEKVSITFDPFMDLTLPLPVENVWGRDIYFFPSSASGRGLIKIPVEMDKNSSIKSLKEHLAKKFNLDPKKTMASEVYKGKFFKHYEDFQTVSETIRQDDDAFFYELDDAPTNYPPSKGKKPRRTGFYGPSYGRFDDDDDVPDPDAPECDQLLVPIFHKVQKQNRYGLGSTTEVFGLPFFIVVNRDEVRSLDAIMRKIVKKYQVLTTRDFYESEASPSESETEAVEVKDELEDINETGEETDDGFVDVSMKDASSMVGSDRKTAKSPRRPLPPGIHDLFTVKVTKRRSGDSAVVTGWQSLETAFDIRERLNREQSASPPRRKTNDYFTSAGLSGRASPASDVSDNDFQDAPEPEQDMMQDVSDDEHAGASSFGASAEYTRANFDTTPPDHFYGNSSGNPSCREFKTPTRSLSPSLADDPPLIMWGEGLICEWSTEGYDSMFGGESSDDLRGIPLFYNVPLIQDQELELRRRRRDERKRKGIHLEDCLDEFAKEEILSEEDPWYCPRCKVHRRASKKFELWKCPDILVIHLKRFSSSRNFRDKIDVLIDCPVTGLNLQERVGLKEEGKSLVYDLIAVDNHYGGLGGGHYTAFAKSWIDGKWYHYDGLPAPILRFKVAGISNKFIDSSVREVSEQKIITPAAYLLFYRRRSETTLGGPRLNRMLSESTNSSGSASSSRSTSPTRAGEGGPSDDSSVTVLLNGRSSGGGTSGLSTIYSGAGNAKLWGDEPPPYSESTGMELVLVPKTQGSPASSKAPNVGFGFGSSLADKDELLGDTDDSVFIGPLLDQAEQTDIPTDIRVDDGEDGLLPTLSDEKNDTIESHNAADNMES